MINRGDVFELIEPWRSSSVAFHVVGELEGREILPLLVFA